MESTLHLSVQVLVGVLLAGLVVGRLVAGWRMRRRLPALIGAGAQVIDVRTAAEYAGAHAPGTRNIPLDELAARVGEIDPTRGVVVCCASGVRSGAAMRWLRARGYTPVVNAGSWRNLPR